MKWDKYIRCTRRMMNNEAKETRQISSLNRYAAKYAANGSLHNERTQIENFRNHRIRIIIVHKEAMVISRNKVIDYKAIAPQMC